MFTAIARPPSEVSLYFEFISFAVSHIVLITLSNGTFASELTDLLVTISLGSKALLEVLALVGFEHCPGCGLGHSISYLLRGEWQLSWQSHPLGTFALVIILKRIFELGKNVFCSNVCSNKTEDFYPSKLLRK